MVSVEACVIISQKTTYVSYIMTESADKENKFVCWLYIIFGRFLMSQVKRKRRKAYVEAGDCVACGCCVKVCPMSAIEVFRGVMAIVDQETCIGCGKCAKACPATVISIREVTE